jgi:hypothetical protein
VGERLEVISRARKWKRRCTRESSRRGRGLSAGGDELQRLGLGDMSGRSILGARGARRVFDFFVIFSCL